MTIQTIIDHLEQIAPPNYQESYDNAGLIVGYPMDEVKGILTCLDSTEAVLDEAISKGCNLVIAHHPIVFRGLKKINGSNYVERVVLKAIKSNIAIYAIHTNLDNVYYNGVNAKIAEKIGLINTKILAPKIAFDKEGTVGSGMIGQLKTPIGEEAFLKHLKTSMQVNCVRHTALLGKPISTVAVCGGAGSFLFPLAKAQDADIFVTADYKYHEFFDADNALIIADIGHYESEQFTIELLFEIISKKFSNFAVYCTELITNPIHYF